MSNKKAIFFPFDNISYFKNLLTSFLNSMILSFEFLPKFSHKNAIKTENWVKIHSKSGHIVAIFETIFGHNGHDFQCYWPYLVSESWEH